MSWRLSDTWRKLTVSATPMSAKGFVYAPGFTQSSTLPLHCKLAMDVSRPMQLGYSLKNIPLQSPKQYRKCLIDRMEQVIKRMRWAAFFYLNGEEREEEQPERFGFRSRTCPPQVDELKAFEEAPSPLSALSCSHLPVARHHPGTSPVAPSPAPAFSPYLTPDLALNLFMLVALCLYAYCWVDPSISCLMIA